VAATESQPCLQQGRPLWSPGPRAASAGSRATTRVGPYIVQVTFHNGPIPSVWLKRETSSHCLASNSLRTGKITRNLRPVLPPLSRLHNRQAHSALPTLSPQAGRGSTGAVPHARITPPSSLPLLQPEHVKHGGVALLAEFRRVGQGALAQRARAGGNRDILLAVELERHGRCREAGADIDLPQLLE